MLLCISGFFPGTNDQDAVRKRLHGFMYTLLTITLTTLETIESQSEKVSEMTENNIRRQAMSTLVITFSEQLTSHPSRFGSRWTPWTTKG